MSKYLVRLVNSNNTSYYRNFDDVDTMVTHSDLDDMQGVYEYSRAMTLVVAGRRKGREAQIEQTRLNALGKLTRAEMEALGVSPEVSNDQSIA